MPFTGWGTADRTFDGDFSDQGWPNVTYECVADLIEMPDYSALQAAAAGSVDALITAPLSKDGVAAHAPGFKGLEAATGLDIAGMVVDFAVGKVPGSRPSRGSAS